jgi:hypothetical protein
MTAPEVVIVPPVWREQFPHIARSTGYGIGLLTRHEIGGTTRLVAHRVVPVTGKVHGADFGPRADVLLLRITPNVHSLESRRMFDEFRPLPTQHCIALALGIASSGGRWHADVFNAGRQTQLAAVRFVGPRMPVLRPAPERQQPFCPELSERWSRTRGALGSETFEQVRRSQILLAGAGRNGSACALTFAMLGVKKLVVVDDDVDELGNLDATVGSSPDGIGMHKAANRARFLNGLLPDGLTVMPIASSFLDPVIDVHLADADLIVTCVDSDGPRLAAALASRMGAPHLDIGTGVFRTQDGRVQQGADVRLCLSGESCVACLGSLRDLADARLQVFSPQGAAPARPRPPWHAERAGSLMTINMTAVNMGIDLWLQLLSGRLDRSTWIRLEWLDSGIPRIDVVHAPVGTTCPICRPDNPG